LAIGARDNDLYVIKIWDDSKGALINQLTQNYSVLTMTNLTNGDLVSSGYSPHNFSLNIWDTNRGTLKRTIKAHTNIIKALSAFPNGDLASAAYDMSIKIWNPIDGTLKETLTGHTSWITSLAVMNNGLLASASYDKTVRIWKV
jgi:WD40 repeat protein